MPRQRRKFLSIFNRDRADDIDRTPLLINDEEEATNRRLLLFDKPSYLAEKIFSYDEGLQPLFPGQR